MKLTQIQLSNFKSHLKTKIPLKKITILIGPTNSGKSSILQALLMLKSTLESNESKFVTKQERFDYGKFEDIVSNGNVDNNIAITIEGEKELSEIIDSEDKVKTIFQYGVGFNERGQNKISFRSEVGLFGVDVTFPYRNKHDFYAWDSNLHKNLDVESPPGLEGFVPRLTVFSKDEYLQSLFHKLFRNGTYVEKLLHNYYYIPFSRTVNSYSLPIEHSRDILSKNPEQSSSALLSKISSNPNLRRKISKYVSKISGKMIETRNVESYNTTPPELTLDFVKNEFSNSIINEGSGSNQLILLLAILVDAPKSSVIAIEEPELHLDPKSQSKLAEILLEQMINDDKQIIFTTHSEHMLYPFLAHIANPQSQLNPMDLSICYFNTDDEGDVTNIESLEINEFGQIKGGLKGFWDVDANTMLNFLGDPDD